MSLIKNLQKYIPLGKKPAPPRREVLTLRPVRNQVIEWDSRSGEDAEHATLHLRIPRRQDRLGKFLGLWLAYPTHKTVELDEFGASVWERCDGETTVEQLVLYTSKTYKMNRRQAEVSVVAFLRMLTQRRLLGLLAPQPKSKPIQPQAAQKEAKNHGKYSPSRRSRHAVWRRH